MRDYLYIWHSPQEKFVVASGLEFRDFVAGLGRGVILLEHESYNSSHDEKSGFDYVPKEEIHKLASEEVYAWGNFSWVDYRSSTFPQIPPEVVAELLYFGHAKRPLHEVGLDEIGNRFLAACHNDGWFLKMYYTQWEPLWNLVAGVLSGEAANAIAAPLEEGASGFWLQHGVVDSEEKTFDIDSVLNRRLR